MCHAPFARLACLVLLCAASAAAHAVEVRVRMFNTTAWPIDYSLQMANVDGDDIRNRTFLGKEYTEDVGDEPSLLPGQVSPPEAYITTINETAGDDAISLNARLHVEWDPARPYYKNYGMVGKVLDRLHTCNLHTGGTLHEGETILLVLSRSNGLWPYMLSEVLPSGDSCTFNLSSDFGDTIWSRDRAQAVAGSGRATAAPAASPPDDARVMRGDELAMRDPQLREQLDAAYQQVTGIDLREVRKRRQYRAGGAPASSPQGVGQP